MRPEYPFVVRFYDEIFQRTYEKELKIGSLITLFSLVAIFISIVGVFGLVVFESEYKRKEIAVRKVLGSTTADPSGQAVSSSGHCHADPLQLPARREPQDEQPAGPRHRL